MQEAFWGISMCLILWIRFLLVSVNCLSDFYLNSEHFHYYKGFFFIPLQEQHFLFAPIRLAPQCFTVRDIFFFLFNTLKARSSLHWRLQRRDTSSCLLHTILPRSRCQNPPPPPSDRDKCLPAWFCVQPHVLWAHQRLINITGSPVIPHCSSVYTQLLLHFYGPHSGSLPTRCCCFNQAPK